MPTTEYHVHAKYNTDMTEEFKDHLRAVAIGHGIPVDEIMKPELNTILDETGFSIWFKTMQAMDRNFDMALYCWARSEYYVSSNGDSYLVRAVRV